MPSSGIGPKNREMSMHESVEQTGCRAANRFCRKLRADRPQVGARQQDGRRVKHFKSQRGILLLKPQH